MKKTAQHQPAQTLTGVTRRDFMKKTTAVGAVAATGTFLGGKPPAYAQSRKLHYLQWSSFIPDADTEIRRQAEEFTKATGVEVTVEMINQKAQFPNRMHDLSIALARHVRGEALSSSTCWNHRR